MGATARERRSWQGWGWVAFVALSSLGLSRAFACAAPLAGLAVLAASTLPRWQAVALVLLAWLGNQAIGFGLSHYPHTATTLGWGGAIGAAALASLATAWTVGRAWGRALQGQSWSGSSLARAAVSFPAAYGAYEGVLFAAAHLLPSGPGAFAPAVLGRIFAINAVALALALAARRLTGMAGEPAGGPARPIAPGSPLEG